MGDTLSPSSPPRPTPAELQQRSNLPGIVIPGQQRMQHHLPLSRLPAVGVSTSSNVPPAGFSPQAPAARLSQWPQQSQSQSQSHSQPRTSSLTTTTTLTNSNSNGNRNNTNHHISPTATASASFSAWSPVSITATAAAAPPLGAPATIRLSPQVEEDIKAAVLEAALAKHLTAAKGHEGKKRNKQTDKDKKKRKKKKKTVQRAPDGRRESPQTTRNWLIAKKVLRWVSLTICAMMVVGEAVLAIFDGAYADTALGICLVRSFLLPFLLYCCEWQ